jgi:hypothetical protein
MLFYKSQTSLKQVTASAKRIANAMIFERLRFGETQGGRWKQMGSNVTLLEKPNELLQYFWYFS